MILKHKETNKLFKVKAGKILPPERVTKEIDGSFLTLAPVAGGEDVMYIYKYWADNDYEVEAEAVVAEETQS